MGRFASVVDLAKSVRAAARATGRSMTEIAAEIVRLRRTAPLFGVSDYFTYRLYADSGREGRKEDFAGWRMERWLADRLNPKVWRGIAEDKCVFLTQCAAVDLPVPHTLAIYHRGGRRLGSLPTLRDGEQVVSALGKSIPYPFFAKPVFGTTGGGAVLVRSADAATGELLLGDGRRVSLFDFASLLDQRSPGVTPEAGYLFQEPIRQHPSVERIVGTTVGCVRFVVLIGDDGPLIHQVVWKVPAGASMTDHFRYGRTGNLVAGVEASSGRVTRVVSGISFGQTSVDCHPDSGQRLAGWSLPDYRAAVELVLRASVQFPMLRFQHWDVALGEAGPLIVELNATGSIFLPQFGTGRGLYDDRLRHFVARYGRAAG